MSRELVESACGKIYRYNCDVCSKEKEFYRLCEYCSRDVCLDCSSYQEKDLFWKNQETGHNICKDCMERFEERYANTATHLNNAITEFELEFRNDRNAKP